MDSQTFLIWCICNTVLGVVNLLISGFTHIQSNYCTSSCCRGWCWFDDELEMKGDKVISPEIQQIVIPSTAPVSTADATT